MRGSAMTGNADAARLARSPLAAGQADAPGVDLAGRHADGRQHGDRPGIVHGLGLTIRRLKPGPQASRYRYAVSSWGRRVTPWRARRQTAMKDAVAGGYATEDGFFWVGSELISEVR